MQQEIHIGRAIRQILREKRISASKFAGMLGKTSSAGWYILRKKHLHPQLLLQISELLGYNFFQHYTPAFFDRQKKLEDSIRLQAAQIDSQNQEIRRLKQKITHLEEMIQLLKELKKG